MHQKNKTSDVLSAGVTCTCSALARVHLSFGGVEGGGGPRDEQDINQQSDAMVYCEMVHLGSIWRQAGLEVLLVPFEFKRFNPCRGVNIVTSHHVVTSRHFYL